MKHIQLTDGSLILTTSTGVTTVTKYSFNYLKIKELVKAENPSQKKIEELLIPPECPNGIYNLYHYPKSDIMAIVHTLPDNTVTHKTLRGECLDGLDSNMKKEYKGVYASFEDIIKDYPEYAL